MLLGNGRLNRKAVTEICLISKITVPMSVPVSILVDTPGVFTPDFPLPFCLLCQEAKGLVFLPALPVTEEQQWTRASKTLPSQGAARVNPRVVLMSSECHAELWVCKCSSSTLCSSSSLLPCLLARKLFRWMGSKVSPGLGRNNDRRTDCNL